MTPRGHAFRIGVLIALLTGMVLATPEPQTPTLTEVQRLTLQVRLLAFQLAQAQLEAYLKGLTMPGYTIDLNTLLYVPVQADNPVKSKGDTP